MKKPQSWHRLFLMAAASAILLFAAVGVCPGAGTHTDIRVGCEQDFKPYAFVDAAGQPRGFGVDLITAVADVMNLSITITPGSWDTVWHNLSAGTIDVLPVAAKLPSRAAEVDFSLPHTETFDAFFVRKGRPVPRDLAEAKGKEIVVMRSGASHHILQDRNFEGKIIPVETAEEMFSLIAAGKHDALLYPKLLGTIEIKDRGLEKLLISGPPIPDYKRVFSFAVRKGDSELLEKLNEGLLIVKTNGQYDKIYEKWLSAEDPWRKHREYIAPALLALFCALVLTGLWVAVLRTQVKKRTAALSESNEQLRRAGSELEHYVQQRTAELSQANAALQSEITERRSAEESAAAAHRQLQSIIDNTPALVYAFDQEKRFIMANTAVAELLNSTPERLLGRRRHEFMPKEDAAWHEANDREASERGIALEFEEHSKLKGRTITWFSTKFPLRDAQGNIYAVAGISADITRRKQAEEQLARDLDAMTRLQKIGTLFVGEDTMEAVFTEIVDAAIAITGADFGNIQLLDPVSGKLRLVAQRGFPKWWLDYWESVSEGQGSCGTALRIGERMLVEDVEQSPIFAGTPALDIQLRAGVRAVQSTPLISRGGRPMGMFSTHYRTPHRADERALRLLDLLARQAADIIERARAEEVLRQSRLDLDRAQEVGNIGWWRLDTRNNVLSWSDENYRIFGVSKGTPLTYETFLSIVHPEDRRYVDSQWQEALRGEKYDIEHRIVADSTVKWVREKAYLEFDGSGDLLGGFGITQDITKRKQAEEELRRSNTELVRFNRAAVERELRMIELKKEINRLCAEAGKPARYAVEGEDKS